MWFQSKRGGLSGLSVRNSGSRKGREGDAFYLPLSTWRPWREVLGFFHAKVAKDARGGRGGEDRLLF